jgi:hypothetical protein
MTTQHERSLPKSQNYVEYTIQYYLESMSSREPESADPLKLNYDSIQKAGYISAKNPNLQT